eukprot:SAG11_NODE_146_length_14788_cov_5.672884_2_plen_59_part_00
MFTLPCRHQAIHEKTQSTHEEAKVTSRNPYRIVYYNTKIIPDRHTGIYCLAYSDIPWY